MSVCGSSAWLLSTHPLDLSFFICDMGLKGPGPANLSGT